VAQTNAVLESTQGVSGMTAESVADLANSLSKVIPIDDELIQSTENMLLTFTKIGKDIFPLATETALDMATALGEDPVNAAMQLGKALNEPIEGVTALRRVGVQLTDQQEEAVKSMMAVGDIAGAQAIILKELGTEFGNSGRAAGKTMAGQMKILGTQIGNVREAIGMALLPVLMNLTNFAMKKLIPALQDLADEWIPKVQAALKQVKDALTPVFEKMKPIFQTLSENKDVMAVVAAIIGGVLVGAFIALAAAAWTAAAGVIAATWPFIAIGVAIVAAIAAGVLIVKHFDDITKAAGDLLEKIESLPVIGDIVKHLVDYVGQVFDQLKVVFDDVIQVANDMLAFFKDIFSGDWGAAWDDLKTLASDALNALVDFVKLGFMTTIYGVLASFVPWDSVKDAIGDFATKFTGAFTGVKDFLGEHWPEIATIISGPFAPLVALASDSFGIRSHLETAMDRIKTYIGDRVGDIVTFFTDLPGRLLLTLGALSGAAASLGSAIRDGIIGGIRGTMGVIGNLEEQLIAALKSLINSAIQAVNDAIPNELSMSILGKKIGIDLPDNPIPMLAAGGILTRPTLALLAERGPEAVIPLSRIVDRVMPRWSAPTVQGGMGATSAYTANISVEREDVAARIDRKLRSLAFSLGRP
jgi:hypothetical protein